MKPTSRAFTLLELLVAVGLTAVMAGAIIAVVTHVSSFWSRTSGRLSAEAQARHALDQLTLDLQSALYRDDGNTWLAANVLGNTGNSGLWDTRNTTANALKPANGAGSLATIATGNLTDARFGLAGTWLRFFTTKRGSNTTTDVANTTSAPVAVGWQIVRRAGTTNTNNTDRRYFLHRAEARPTTAANRPGTLESGFGITATAYASASALTNNTGALRDPRSVRAPQDPGTIIAENVIDFGVRFHVHTTDASGARVLTRIFPSGNGDLAHAATLPPGVPNGSGALTDCFPEVADVLVRVLTDEGARLIAAYEANPQRVTAPANRTPQQYWWDLALAHSRVFTRRVVLNAKPL